MKTVDEQVCKEVEEITARSNQMSWNLLNKYAKAHGDPEKVTLTKFDWEQIRALGFLNEQLERYYQYERTNKTCC